MILINVVLVGMCDSERKKVVGIRIGESMKLCFNWFYYSKPIGKKLDLLLNSGDGYIMCEMATGNKWKKRSEYNLRHSAGCDKFTSLDRFFKKNDKVEKMINLKKSNKKKFKIIDKNSEKYSLILKKFNIY